MDYKPTDSAQDGLNASKDTPAEPPISSEAPPPAVAEEQPAALVETTPAPAVETPPAPVSKTEEEHKPLDSRDVSPMGGPKMEPQATTGVGSSTIPSKNGPSASTSKKRQSFVDVFKNDKGTPESSKTTGTETSKKEKRRSFFGKLKDKLKS